MSGRLTLTWANKDRALLSHGEAGYEWVEQDDPRVREVRLLDEIGRVGEDSAGTNSAGTNSAGTNSASMNSADPTGATRSTVNASDNLLIRGDSLDALRALVRSPEYAEVYRGKVKLVYIDPPFNTGQAFEHYDDSLEHSVWLGMMRERLVLIRDLLAPDGSVWVHLDDAEMAYCRVLLDEIFGRSNFVATVVWEKADSPRNDAMYFSSRHDSIIVFRRSDNFGVNRMNQSEPATHYNKMDAEGRSYYTKPLRAMAGKDSTREARPSMYFAIEAPDGSEVFPRLPDGRDGRWRWGPERVATEAERIEWVSGKAGWQPYYRIYADTSAGTPPDTLWRHPEVGSNRTSKLEMAALFQDVDSFDTPKPERLLERVIHIGSNPGDIVLDCFAGSGTTAAVAHKMGRRWVTVELSENTADTFTRPRLEKVVAGSDPGGITESAGWTGGGGFRDLRIAPSVWDVIDDNLGVAVFQDASVDDATYIRSVTAQLGYSHMEHPVFCGQKGRSRLVVATGVVDSVAVADIVSALGEGETVLIAALSNTEDAPVTLRELSRGSRILRTPSQLFPTRTRVVK